jgi:hypothetical protein
MMDITDRFNAFRECARHLWNCHLAAVVSSDRWAVRDDFDDVCVILFRTMVVGSLAEGHELLSCPLPGRVPERAHLDRLHVVPAGSPTIPVMINRDRSLASGYWDHPTCRLPEKTELRLVSWFDFDELGFRDFKYLLVRVVTSTQPEIVGRAALVECEHVRVLFDPEPLVGSPGPT